jgi:hypothetical protein
VFAADGLSPRDQEVREGPPVVRHTGVQVAIAGVGNSSGASVFACVSVSIERLRLCIGHVCDVDRTLA